MPKSIDQRGKTFGDFLVLENLGTVKYANGNVCVKWLCRCKDCGYEKMVYTSNLRKLGLCKCHSGGLRGNYSNAAQPCRYNDGVDCGEKDKSTCFGCGWYRQHVRQSLK